VRIAGPRLTLRYPDPADAPALFALARDPAVTRYFSWGPYTDVAQPAAYVEGLPAKREAGELLDFLVEDAEHGAVGITGLSGLSRRDRRCVVGSWFGHRYWGSGLNRESKALIAGLAFAHLGMKRLGSYAAAVNGRSQVALERIGFRREGTLLDFHRHGDRVYDVVSFAMTRAAWERSPLRTVTVRVEGAPPPTWDVRGGA